MDGKLKLALAALLGFSAACTSVKNSPRTADGGKQKQEADTAVVKERPGNPRVVVMYGVRTPVRDTARIKRLERPDTLPPVAETPREEDVPTPSGK